MLATVSASESTSVDRLGRLFDRSHRRLYRLGCRMARDSEQARDLVQEAFLRAARRPEALPADDAAAEAWLARVLINLFRDEVRKRQVRRRTAEPAPAETAAGSESALIARDLVRSALAALPPRRRAVLALHDLEELPVREIARTLGLTEVTVRWHLARGRRQVAAELGAAHRSGRSSP